MYLFTSVILIHMRIFIHERYTFIYKKHIYSQEGCFLAKGMVIYKKETY